MLRKAKALMSVTIALVLILSFGVYASAEEPIAISTKEQLNDIRNNLSGHYYLTNNIVFTKEDFLYGGDFYNGGYGFVPIGDADNCFTGTLDGRGYVISGIKSVVSGASSKIDSGIASSSNLALLSDWTGDYDIEPEPSKTVSPAVGMIGVNKGVIKNLTLANCEFEGVSKNKRSMYVGAVAGYNVGEIYCCATYNNTATAYLKSFVGSIAGFNNGGKIENCYSRSRVKSSGTGGGLVGGIISGNLSMCYSNDILEQMFDGNLNPIAGDEVPGTVSKCNFIGNSEIPAENEIPSDKAPLKESFENFDFDNTWHISKLLKAPVLNSLILPELMDKTMGDADKSGIIDLADVATMAQYLAGWDILADPGVMNVNFDIDENGTDIIDLSDVSYLAQYLAGWADIWLY